MAARSSEIPTLARMQSPPIHRWIKTECGRAKYSELAARPGALARLRLSWFVLIAALRDWRLSDPDQRQDQADGSDA
jgi:hypothetical protein